VKKGMKHMPLPKADKPSNAVEAKSSSSTGCGVFAIAAMVQIGPKGKAKMREPTASVVNAGPRGFQFDAGFVEGRASVLECPSID
jgi:hypothetical protein